MLFESNLKSLNRVYQGKVRDIYEVDDLHWLIVTCDRLSAFDVILPDPIPMKGHGAKLRFPIFGLIDFRAKLITT